MGADALAAGGSMRDVGGAGAGAAREPLGPGPGAVGRGGGGAPPARHVVSRKGAGV